jgi:hypothetical protein
LGLLYERYSDPIGYLTTGYETIGIYETVVKVYADKNNHDLWELYLAVRPNQSFNDWKAEIKTGESEVYATENVGTKNKEETQKIVEQSKKILNGYVPELKNE